MEGIATIRLARRHRQGRPRSPKSPRPGSPSRAARTATVPSKETAMQDSTYKERLSLIALFVTLMVTNAWFLVEMLIYH